MNTVPPNGQGKECRYGWLCYRRAKTNKQFHQPNEPVFVGGTSRPNKQFQFLRELARIKPKHDVETREERLCVL